MIVKLRRMTLKPLETHETTNYLHPKNPYKTNYNLTIPSKILIEKYMNIIETKIDSFSVNSMHEKLYNFIKS